MASSKDYVEIAHCLVSLNSLNSILALVGVNEVIIFALYYHF